LQRRISSQLNSPDLNSVQHKMASNVY